MTLKNHGTTLKNYGVMGVMVLWVGLLLAACGGGAGGPTNPTGGGNPNPLGGTLTFTGLATVSSIPGLGFYAPLSNTSAVTGGMLYTDTFTDLNGREAVLAYTTTAAQDTLNFFSTANYTAVPPIIYYNVGTPLAQPAIGSCWVSGISNAGALPLCTAWGVVASRVAGTVTFASAPVYDTNNIAATGTMSGTLSFPPF